MIRWLRGKDYVRDFAVDTARHESLSRHSRIGVQSVPVEQVVGSVGRAHELRADFRSFHTWDGDLRYHTVHKLMKSGVTFSPVELYRLDDRYYVVDGHHRVAAARTLGQLYLDAVVTEFWPASDTASGSPARRSAA